MKLLGAVLLIAGGLAWGLGRAGALKGRVSALEDWRRLMLHMRTEILYAGRPLGELIALDGGPFGREAQNQADFAADPLGALERAGAVLLENPEDRELFGRFVGGLGASGTRGQEEHFLLYEELLKGRMSQAREEWGQKGRVYVGVGVFVGMAVAVVLM